MNGENGGEASLCTVCRTEISESGEGRTTTDVSLKAAKQIDRRMR